MKFNDKQTLYVRSMGKALRVTAIFTDDDEANRHMARSDNDDAVVAVFGPYILLADKYDHGTPIPRS